MDCIQQLADYLEGTRVDLSDSRVWPCGCRTWVLDEKISIPNLTVNIQTCKAHAPLLKAITFCHGRLEYKNPETIRPNGFKFTSTNALLILDENSNQITLLTTKNWYKTITNLSNIAL